MDDDTGHGSVVGLIKPPKVVRELIEVTSEHVSKNGKSFEDNIRKLGKAKFEFINPGHVYYAYYVSRLDALTLNQHQNATNPVDKEEQPAEQQESSREENEIVSKGQKLSSTISLKEDKQHYSSEAPPTLAFLARHPGEPIKRKVVDLIKLTAKYAAINGDSFLSSLRASNQSEFNFLESGNQHNDFFNSMVQQYKTVSDWSETTRLVKAKFCDFFQVLDRAIHRFEFEAAQEQLKLEKKAKVDKDLVGFHEIDWHDFALVETIDFDGKPKAAVQVSDGTDKLKILHDYQPAAVGSSSSKPKIALPDGRELEVDGVNEHMRIETIDPKWKEQQEKYRKNQSRTAFVDSDVSSNLLHLAANRPDVFSQNQRDSSSQDSKRRRKG